MLCGFPMNHHLRQRDPLKWLVYLLISLFVYGFTFVQMNDAVKALYFTGSIAGALLVLTAIAQGLMWMVRRFFPSSWNYLWRQGLANLYRPNNQTTVLIISIGLGTALICTLLFTQSVLINRITLSTSANQPNIVLFDIQSKQGRQCCGACHKVWIAGKRKSADCKHAA